MADLWTEKYKFQHRLQGMVNGVGADIAEALEKALSAISGKILALEVKAEQTKSLIRKKKYLLAQKAEIEKVLQQVYEKIGKEIKTKSIEVAEAAPAITIKIMDQTIGITLGQPKLNLDQIENWFDSSRINGQFFSDYLGTLKKNTASRIVRETQQAMLLNESIRQAGKRLQNALNIGRHSANALAQTSIFAAYNWAELKTYKKDDQITQVRWLCELDKQTCEQCYPNDLKVFPISDAPPLPVHMRCRCMYTPVFWFEDRETGSRISRLDAGHRTVHHRDGTTSTKHTDRTVQFVPANITYTQWMQGLATSPDAKDRAFVKEALGPTRAELLATGKLTMKSLSYRGKLRTVKELMELIK